MQAASASVSLDCDLRHQALAYWDMACRIWGIGYRQWYELRNSPARATSSFLYAARMRQAWRMLTPISVDACSIVICPASKLLRT